MDLCGSQPPGGEPLNIDQTESWLQVLLEDANPDIGESNDLNADEPFPTFASTGEEDISVELEGLRRPFAEDANANGHENDGGAHAAIAPEAQVRDKPPLHSNNTERDILELADLNLRIYKMSIMAFNSCDTLMSALSTLPDEMMNITTSLLGVMRRIAIQSKQRSQVSHRLSNLESSISDLGVRSHRHATESSIYSNASLSVEDIPDTGTVLLVFSCHQRLLDLFKKLCRSLPTCLRLPANLDHHCMGSNRRGCEPERYERPLDAENMTHPSNAQIVMVVELIKHFLSRLNHGQKQLYKALHYSEYTMPVSPVSSSYSFSTPQAPSESPGRSIGIMTPNDGVEALRKSKIWSGRKPTLGLETARLVLERMISTQTSLNRHIDYVKLLLEDLDEV